MKYEFKIGEPVKKASLPKNVMKINVENMHGDADQYTTSSYKFNLSVAKDVETAEHILSIYEIFKNLDHNSQCDFMYSNANRFRILHDNGITDNNVIDRVFDLVFERDCTNDGNTWALPQSLNIVYYNEVGTEFHVTAIPKE